MELFRGLGAPEPVVAARDLVSLLEGLLFDRLHGARSLGPAKAEAESLADLRGPIRRALNYGA
jgi:hypothetical protein